MDEHRQRRAVVHDGRKTNVERKRHDGAGDQPVAAVGVPRTGDPRVARELRLPPRRLDVPGPEFRGLGLGQRVTHEELPTVRVPLLELGVERLVVVVEQGVGSGHAAELRVGANAVHGVVDVDVPHRIGAGRDPGQIERERHVVAQLMGDAEVEVVRVRILVVVVQHRDVRRGGGKELLARPAGERVRIGRVVDDDRLLLVPPPLAEIRERADVLEELPVAALHRGATGIVRRQVEDETDPRPPVVRVAARIRAVVEGDGHRERDVADVLVEGADLEVVTQPQVQRQPVRGDIVLDIRGNMVHRHAVVAGLRLHILRGVGVRVILVERVVGLEGEPAGVVTEAVRLEIDPVVVHADLQLVVAAEAGAEEREVVLELPAGLRPHLVVAGAGAEVRAADIDRAIRQSLGVEVAGVERAVGESRAHFVLGEGALETELVQSVLPEHRSDAEYFRVPRNREVEAFGGDPAGVQVRAVLVLPGHAQPDRMVVGQLVVDPAEPHVAPLVLGESAVVCRKDPAGVHRVEQGLVGALVGEEEVRPVFDDRAAQRAAPLVPPVVRFFTPGLPVLVGQRGERLVAEEDEGASGEVVRPRLGHHRHQPAGGEAVFRLEVARRDLELADRVHGEVLARFAHLRPGVVYAVHDESVRVVAAAGAHVHIAPVVEAADRVLAGPGSEQRQVHPTARRHRQVLDLEIGDRGRDIGPAGVEQRGGAGHRDRLLDLGDRQVHVHDDGLLDGEDHAGGLDRRETAEFGGDGVRPGQERREAVVAFRVGDRRARDAGVLVDRGDGHAGEHRAGGVGDPALDLPVLGERRSGEEEEKGGRQRSRLRTDPGSGATPGVSEQRDRPGVSHLVGLLGSNGSGRRAAAVAGNHANAASDPVFRFFGKRGFGAARFTNRRIPTP